MRGSIVKRGSGYSYVVSLGRDDETGRKRQKWVSGFRTKRDAQAALTEALGRVQAGQFADPGRATVAEFLANWLDAVTPSLRPSTVASYRMIVDHWLVPQVGQVRLASLTPGNLNKAYGRLLTGGGKGGGPLSARSVRYAHTVLGKALSDAIEWGLLARNPARAAKPPRQARPEMKCWDVAEAKAFLSAVADDRLSAMWLLMVTTGLRRGEVAGLRWSDVDLDTGALAVRHALVTVDYKVLAAEPKTAKGRRTVALDPATVAALRQHRARQGEERVAAWAVWTESGLVFVQEDGRPYHPERLTIMFKRYVKEAKLPPIRLHDLRHTSATLALAAGIHPKVVQERLGHSSINITMDTYSHVVNGLQQEAADRLAALLI